MKKMTICIVISALGFFVFWQPLQARAEGIKSVVIDGGEKAYTSFVSLTDEMTREAKPNVDARETAKMISWRKFKKSAGKYVTAGIIKNEYPGSEISRGIVEFLSKHPATPVGVTWNGGVAFTAFDYIYAEKAFKQYRSNSREYEKIRARELGKDPLSPSGHFRTLLGWK